MTFVALGAPGLLLTVVILLTIREPRRGASEGPVVDAKHYGLYDTIGYLWSLRSLRWLAVGASLNVFAVSAKLVWSAPFLIRVHNMNTDEAGAWLGITTGVGGIAGIVLGGLAAQRLARSDPAWMLRIPALTSALAAPFVVLFLTLPASSAPVMNLGASFFGASMMGPVLAVTQTLAKVRMRALAAALVTLVVNLIGAGLGPLTVGALERSARSFFGAELNPVCPARTRGHCAAWSCALFQSRRTPSWRRSSSARSSDRAVRHRCLRVCRHEPFGQTVIRE